MHLIAVDDERWTEAHRRALVLRPLLAAARSNRADVASAAAQLGLSERQVWSLLKRLREASGAVSALVVERSRGGVGNLRLASSVEGVTALAISELYLTPQRLSFADLILAIRKRCRDAGLSPPSASTVRRRVAAIPRAARSRRDPIASPDVIHGATPKAAYPLDALQIDHTKVDLIVVDAVDRQPIGRPWLSLAIDVRTRMIAGFHLDLEAPSTTAVGLCLLHCATDKARWLRERDIEAAWPIVGKPARVGVDNGRDFHSAAFERGCAEHGIVIDWRPPGRPHFGGVVERVIGTVMRLVHSAPGTTFSNVAARGAYNSERRAVLTMAELERWLAIAIAKRYHHSPHEGLDGATPFAAYGQAVAGQLDEQARTGLTTNYLIDFLPVVRRSAQRDGITIDHVTYFSTALAPLVAARERGARLYVRRDPRDLSRIFVLDEADHTYLEVPCRDLGRPAVALWEHRAARRRVAEAGREASEASVFEAVEEMRAIESRAAKLTHSARRDRERRSRMPTAPNRPALRAVAVPDVEVTPFDVIEPW